MSVATHHRRTGEAFAPPLRRLTLARAVVPSPAPFRPVDIQFGRMRFADGLPILPVSLAAVPGTGATAAQRPWREIGGVL